MLIIWGSRLYGKVDEVPGFGHVATRFAHVWFLPLIPMGSVFVIEQSGNAWRGASVGLSGKSVLAGWLRIWLPLAACVLGIMGVAMLNDRRGSPAIGAVELTAALLAAVGAVLVWTHRSFTRASYERAREIAERVGLNEEGQVLLELAYGRVGPADAEATLRQLRDDATAMAALPAQASQMSAPPAAPPVVRR